jgi:hypothetical protein
MTRSQPAKLVHRVNRFIVENDGLRYKEQQGGETDRKSRKARGLRPALPV